jgi:thiamine-phosphate pyrophosphorylase
MLRVIDANANRAREALRVLEDSARFCGGLGPVAARLKSMRHRLQEVVERIPQATLAAARDVEGDPGREVSTEREGRRADDAAVAAAAGGRLAEALRSIEEALKTESIAGLAGGASASAIERLRYESYEIAPIVERALRARRPRQWRCCLLLTIADCRRDWESILHSALEGGVDAVQVREKSGSDRERVEHVRRVIEIARPEGAAVVVNDRVDLALAADADGAHLGRDDLPVARARAIAGGDLLIGASSHDVAEACAAIEAGADLIGIGCMFASTTRPDLAAAGPRTLEAVLAAIPGVRHLAIGGIEPANVGDLVDVGAQGVAVGRAITAAEDPRGVVERLRLAFEGVPAAGSGS